MYCLRLTCAAKYVDFLSAELWEAGTECIQEIDGGERTTLIAAFKNNNSRHDLLAPFASYSPEWQAAALQAARENFLLNELPPILVAGSAECLADESSDVTVANISATVLLSILNEVVRITRPKGWVVLTGFPEEELQPFQRIFPDAEISQLNEWRCLERQAFLARLAVRFTGAGARSSAPIDCKRSSASSSF